MDTDLDLVTAIDLSPFRVAFSIKLALFALGEGNAGAIKPADSKTALLDADLVVSPMHIAVAAARALHSQRPLTLGTRDDFIYYLSASTNISESIKRHTAVGKPSDSLKGGVLAVDFEFERTPEQFLFHCRNVLPPSTLVAVETLGCKAEALKSLAQVALKGV